jgi:hypothetical protein
MQTGDAITIKSTKKPWSRMPEQRYTISELIEIAEQQTAEAKRALQANEPDSTERVQQWSDTLKALQIMKERGVPDSLRDIPNS